MDDLKGAIKDYHRGIVSAEELVNSILAGCSVNNPFIAVVFQHINIQSVEAPNEMVEKLTKVLNL